MTDTKKRRIINQDERSERGTINVPDSPRGGDDGTNYPLTRTDNGTKPEKSPLTSVLHG